MNWWQALALGAAAAMTGGAALAPAAAAGAGTAAAGTGAALGTGAATGGLLGTGAATGAGTAAATGTATGATTGGLLGAGTGATASTGAGTTIGGLLGNPGTAATYGTGLGTQQTSMLAAQEAGMGASNYMGGATKLATEAKPYIQAAQTGMQFAPQPEAPPQAPMLQQSVGTGPQTLGQLVSDMKQQQTAELEAAAQERRARRSRGLLGV